MRNISRRRFLLAGLTASSALALGAGAYLFLPRLLTAARLLPLCTREFDMTGTVNTVAWSPDSHAFAAGGASGQATIWRASDGQQLATLLPPTSHAGVWSVAWSPNSQYFAIAWSDGRVSIWKVQAVNDFSHWHQESVLLISPTLSVLPIPSFWPMIVTWSPDGTRLAVGDSAGGLHLWDPSTGQMLHMLQASRNKPGIPVSSLAWSPDGTKIVALDIAAAAYAIWSTTTGKAMLLPSQHRIPIRVGWWNNMMALGWSPDGTIIAASAGGNLLLWQWKPEKREWEYTRSMPVASWRITSLTWSPDSKRFATADRDNTIRFWRASTGQQLGSYSVSPPQVGNLDSDSRAQGYMDTDFQVNAVAWAPGGKYLLSGDYAGRVLLWEIH